MKVHPALSYTLYRFSLIVAVACVLFLVGFRSWALVLGAFVISLPLSWFVLRKQRQQLAARIAEHQERRQAEREELRRALDVEPQPDSEPDAEDATEPAAKSDSDDSVGREDPPSEPEKPVSTEK